jgi:hypothetical protein
MRQDSIYLTTESIGHKRYLKICCDLLDGAKAVVVETEMDDELIQDFDVSATDVLLDAVSVAADDGDVVV